VPIPILAISLPIRAQSIDVAQVSVANLPPGATWSWSVAPGFGQAVLTVTINATLGGGISSALVQVPLLGSAIPVVPSLYANAILGQTLQLGPLQGGLLSIVSLSDPQNIFNGSFTVHSDGSLTATIIQSEAALGYHLVILTANLTTGPGAQGGELQQMLLWKINITGGSSALVSDEALTSLALSASAWAYVDLRAGGYYNADIGKMFVPGTYVSPRPETCGVRIGTDGFSAWTFPWWGSPVATPPTFSNVANLSISSGVIQTPQGAQFLLNASIGEPNIAFTTLWDNYAPAVNVNMPPPAALPNASHVWLLVAGSTNPMQTLFANAILRFYYASGAIEELELIPPINFWSLSGWGTADYDYTTDAFCLPPQPPPTVNLGVGTRAMVYAHPILPGAGALTEVQLETLSQEVVIGLLSVSLMA
jgi:hypothetical protein